MGKGKTLILGLLCGCFMVGCSNTTKEKQLAATILQDSTLNKVDSMARSVIRQGLNAGSGYSQIWARDMNTFMKQPVKKLTGRIYEMPFYSSSPCNSPTEK